MDNSITMFISLFLVAQLIQFSYADVNCLQCNDVLHPTDCTTFQKCRKTERCFVEAFLTSSGEITYDLGCREAQQCDGIKPIIRRHIPEGINTQKVDRYGNLIANSTKRTSTDPVICSNCCHTKLCNSLGCGSNGFASFRGPICANCPRSDSVAGCNTLKVCKQHEVCMLLKSIDPSSHLPNYQTKCEQEQVCNDQFNEYSNIYAMFMGKKLDAISNGVRCNIKCCKADLCNTDCKSGDQYPQQSMIPQPGVGLPKHPKMPPQSRAAMPQQQDLRPKPTDITSVQPAEFVDMRNTHYPKGHPWNNENLVVTGSPTPFDVDPRQANRLPSSGPDPQGMPSYKVSSESPAILSALGISELPMPKSSSSSAGGRNRWIPAHEYDPHVGQSRSDFGGPQGSPQRDPHGGPQGSSQGGPQRDPHGGPQGTSQGGPQRDPRGGPQGSSQGGPQRDPHGGPQGNSQGGPQRGPLGGPQGSSQSGPQRSRHGDIPGSPQSYPQEQHGGPQGSSRPVQHDGLQSDPRGQQRGSQRGPTGSQRGGSRGGPNEGFQEGQQGQPRDPQRGSQGVPNESFQSGPHDYLQGQHGGARGSSQEGFQGPQVYPQGHDVGPPQGVALGGLQGRPQDGPHGYPQGQHGVPPEGFQEGLHGYPQSQLGAPPGSLQGDPQGFPRDLHGGPQEGFQRGPQVGPPSEFHAHHRDPQVVPKRGPQRQQENLGTTMTSSQNIDKTLSAGIQRVSDPGPLIQEFHIQGMDQMTSNLGPQKGPQDRHMPPQRHSQTNFLPDQHNNPEADFFGQSQQEPGIPGNAGHDGLTRQREMDPSRHFDPHASSNTASRNREPTNPSSRYNPQQGYSSNAQRPNETAVSITDAQVRRQSDTRHPSDTRYPPDTRQSPNSRQPSDPRNFDSARTRSTTGVPLNIPIAGTNFDFLSETQRKRVAEVMGSNRQPSHLGVSPMSGSPNNVDRQGQRPQAQTDQFSSMNSHSRNSNRMHGAPQRNADPYQEQNVLNIQSALSPRAGSTNAGMPDTPKETQHARPHTPHDPFDMTGHLNNNENTFSKRNNVSPWGTPDQHSNVATWDSQNATGPMDPRSRNFQSPSSGFNRNNPYPDLPYPSRDLASQGIKDIQRITTSPNLERYGVEYQQKQQQQQQQSSRNSFRGRHFEQPLPVTVISAPPVFRGLNHGGGMTTVPIIDVSTVAVPSPCVANPCVRGTCIEKPGGTYSCKCPPGSWGKDCEQSLLISPQANITVTTKAYKIPKTTPEIDACFSNPCMRGKCEFYHKTYRCKCDYGFYGRDCEKVSLGGAAFLGAMGLNIDACQAQATPCVNGNCTTANNKVACSCEPGYTGTTCSEVLDHCSSLPCVRGTCLNGTQGFECVCPPGFTGVHCESINYCATTPCRHGTCSNMVDGYVCNCSPGYTGTQCEAVDHCSSSPCVRGRCTNRQNEFDCSCPAGYIGKQCEAIDFCFPSPCVHGTCINSNTGYTCSCPKGFIGQQCQVIDHCASRPCLRGDCENLQSSYACACPIGYIGKQCQTIDHCASKPCAHGRCVNGDVDYECKCPYGYTGKQCQTVDHCSSSPCARGTCKNTHTGFTCDCPPGYTGPQCLTVDHCHTTPCARGTCLNSNTGYTCILSSGYIGSHLQGNGPAAPNDHCASSPCVHGSCVSSNTGFVCQCQPGYFGTRCEVYVPGKAASAAPPRLAEFHYTPPPQVVAFRHPQVIDHCSSHPCQRGTCVSDHMGFTCYCPPGFKGKACEIKDHCIPPPCQRGNCISNTTSFHCNCPPGYNGQVCEVIDHCYSSPCVQGTCVSSQTGFMCYCPPGVTGQRCDTMDPCATSPCLQGNCHRTHTGYACECHPGFTGPHCDTPIVTIPDLCASYPCLRGTCTSSEFGFQCNCPSGFTGTYCEVDMYAMTDHCASFPCQRGTCVNTDLGYQCNCPPGFTGVQCEVNTAEATGATDICTKNLCQYGECVPGTTSYTCQCYKGYSGMNCDVPDGSYCDLNPGVYALCGHGTCRSVGSGYECICDPRYNGTHCLFQYECFGGHVCFHDGTCVNKQYCSCRSGYSGNHCGTLHSYDQIKLKPGDIVTRGKDWQYGNQDGGLHSVGKVISITGEFVNVMWVNGEKYHYKMKVGKYDLELAP